MLTVLIYRQQTERQQAAADEARPQRLKARDQRASRTRANLAEDVENCDIARLRAASNKLLDDMSETPDRGSAAA